MSTIEQRLWNSRFPTWQPRLIRLGWALVLLPTLLAFLLPDQITAGNQVVQLLYLLSPVLLAGVILIGILCLLSGYLQFFSSAWGFLLLLPLLTVSLHLTLNPAVETWLLRHLTLLGGMWAMALIPALGFSLAIYLFFRDRAVRLFALTTLISVWLTTLYTVRLGPQQMLEGVADGSFVASLAPAGSLLCLLYCVTLLAPMGFLWHTLRLLRDEYVGVGMLDSD